MNACRLSSGTAFPCINAHAAEFAGLKGRKNGELLRAAESAGSDVLLTIDHAMARQQNLAGRELSLVLLRSRTSQIEDLLPLVGRDHYAGQYVAIPSR